MIIKIVPEINNAHDNQSVTPSKIPNGYVDVPPELEEKAEHYLPFAKLIFSNGKLIDIAEEEHAEVIIDDELTSKNKIEKIINTI